MARSTLVTDLKVDLDVQPLADSLRFTAEALVSAADKLAAAPRLPERDQWEKDWKDWAERRGPTPIELADRLPSEKAIAAGIRTFYQVGGYTNNADNSALAAAIEAAFLADGPHV